eukprot:6518172-Prymnesium_polylepis.1
MILQPQTRPVHRPVDELVVRQYRNSDVTSRRVAATRRRVNGHDNDWSYGGLRTSDGGYEQCNTRPDPCGQ